MEIAIYAPVPAVLLRSARETCKCVGRVAFGTNSQQLFEEIDSEFGPGLPVIIHPTVRYGDPDGLGKLTFGATYIGYERANNKGVHKVPTVRPRATSWTARRWERRGPQHGSPIYRQGESEASARCRHQLVGAAAGVRFPSG